MLDLGLHLACDEERDLIELLFDGELGAEEQRELEAHLEGCAACRAYLEERVRITETLRASAASVRAPVALEARIASALDSADLSAPPSPEEARLFGLAPPAAVIPLRRRWLHRLPVAASAAALLLFVWIFGGGFGPRSESPQEADLVEDATLRHARALPLELVSPDPSSVRRWAMGKVDFNPRVPRFRAGLRPIGARLSHVLNRPAVYLVYQEPSGGRAGLFVFAEDRALHLPSQHLRMRRAGGRNVFLTSRRGYNVALWRDHGIVYSLVSDLDEPALLRLVETTNP